MTHIPVGALEQGGKGPDAVAEIRGGVSRGGRQAWVLSGSGRGVWPVRQPLACGAAVAVAWLSGASGG